MIAPVRFATRLFPLAVVCLTVVCLAALEPARAESLQKISINYPSRTGTAWPYYIAKEGGYYQKNGLDVNLVFGVHPAGIAMVVSGEAAMTNYTLEQAMQAASKDGSLVFLGSSFKKSLFAMMVGKNINTVADLKGKRFGVSQIGDAPYNYAVNLLAHSGLSAKDVQWVPGAPTSTDALRLSSAAAWKRP
jgi:ABC-type nitrate/sulfonate/bicarbonate transport system substrate-binding protein